MGIHYKIWPNILVLSAIGYVSKYKSEAFEWRGRSGRDPYLIVTGFTLLLIYMK